MEIVVGKDDVGFVGEFDVFGELVGNQAHFVVVFESNDLRANPRFSKFEMFVADERDLVLADFHAIRIKRGAKHGRHLLLQR